MRTKILLAITALLLFASGMTAMATPYAVLRKDNSLHFLVSNSESEVVETLGSNTITKVWEVNLNQTNEFPNWYDNLFQDTSTVFKVIFEESFKNVEPNSCYCWFYNFKNLKEFEGIENLNTEKVTYFNSMFNGCESLTSLDLSSWNTSSGTMMTSMFAGCSSLTELKFGVNFVATGVTDMNSMFADCSKLTSLNLSSFKPVNVSLLNNMFYNCSRLTSLDLSGFKTKNETTMSAMFYNCSSLKSLDIRNFSTTTTMNDDIFAGCTNLRTLILGGAFAELSQDLLPNPNYSLIFVDKDTTVPVALRNNVVVGDKCTYFEINQGDASGNNQLYWQAPYDFKADKVTINREFKKDTPYTLYMPFAMDASQYGTFYTGGTLNEDGSYVMFSKVTTPYTVANTPYMFIPNDNFTGITIQGSVEVTPLNGETEVAGLQGVNDMKKFTADEADRNIYYGWADGQFHRAKEGAKVDACRAYFRLTDSEAANAPARITAKFGEDDTTGVTEIDSADRDLESPMYNLNGQRVGEGYRGIVVKKGAKTVNISR